MNTRHIVMSVVATIAVSFRAAAVEWSAEGGTYTVPADTTNEVSDADFQQVNALSKVIFSNAGSALWFTTTNYPSNVSFEGAGSVIMANEVDLGKSITLKRSTDDAASGNFVTFDFIGGIKSNETSGAINFSPSLFSNATVRFHRELPFNQFSSTKWCGRFDFAEDLGTVFKDVSLAVGAGQFGVVRQRGGNVTLTKSDSLLGAKGKGSVAAWLLEGGSLAIRNNSAKWFAFGQYVHFRQMGGTLYVPVWQREDSCNTNALPADFIYGGSAVATNSYNISSTKHFIGAMTLAVMDDAQVSVTGINGTGDNTNYAHVVALNGGVLTEGTTPDSKSVYFSFNGGTLRNESSGPGVYGISSMSPSERWVRVYERGGSVENNTCTNNNSLYLDHPPILEPVGNVVWSIPVSTELAQKVFQTPPAVVITDSTGAGSNAVAVADYDFDSGKVTNITVLCRGENYSGTAGDVSANLFFKRNEPLLETPLDCSVGPCLGGDFRFAGRRAIRVRDNVINTYHGATIVDLDVLREADHPEISTTNYWLHTLFIGKDDKDRTCFPNSTGIVVRSGCLWLGNGVNFSRAFPAATRLELYGGHLAHGTYPFPDVVIGGETWLASHTRGYTAMLNIPEGGTLWVDVADAKTNTPKLCYGTLQFGAGVKLTIKNPELLKTRAFKGEWTLLDLSSVTTTLTNIGNLVLDAELVQDLRRYGRLKWDAAARKLTWRSSDGFCVRLK